MVARILNLGTRCCVCVEV